MPAVPITKIPAGMRNWAYWRPPLSMAEIEIWREGWTDTAVVTWDSIHPSMNCYGLYWREPQARAPETTHAIN